VRHFIKSLLLLSVLVSGSNCGWAGTVTFEAPTYTNGNLLNPSQDGWQAAGYLSPPNPVAATIVSVPGFITGLEGSQALLIDSTFSGVGRVDVNHADSGTYIDDGTSAVDLYVSFLVWSYAGETTGGTQVFLSNDGPNGISQAGIRFENDKIAYYNGGTTNNGFVDFSTYGSNAMHVFENVFGVDFFTNTYTLSVRDVTLNTPAVVSKSVPQSNGNLSRANPQIILSVKQGRAYFDNIRFEQVVPVPEPSTAVLELLGMAALMWFSRRATCI
jgi:hypothetical protein